jgi:hypothetical protein
MKKRRKTVWVVMYHYFMRFEGEVIAENSLFHVASTKRQAEEYIRSRNPPSSSWWEIHPKILDCRDVVGDRYDIFYYTHKGNPSQSYPYAKAERAFRREEAKHRPEE